MEIVLDTNALIYAAKYKIDIIKMIRQTLGMTGVYVPNLVVSELKNLSKNADKKSDKDAAWLAYQIVTKSKITEIELTGKTDEAIMAYAAGHGASVLTNDTMLKFKLKQLGVKVYNIRQKKLVEEA
ncbi:MAG: PIN domain-containing protein [archaeon]